MHPDHTPRSKLDLAIEGCWLLALCLVPLAFNGPDIVVLFLQPKDFVLHFAALLIVAFWGFEWAIGAYRPNADLSSWAGFRRWLGSDPRHWALAGAAGFGVTAAISTVLSPLPAVSLWGRDYAELGYELYSVLSLLVIFFAIALRVREPEQIRRILWVIAGAGVLTGLYGISQRFGWDPIGNGQVQERVFSSFGNPIYFGSYLVMSTVVTIGLTLDRARNADRWWLPLVAILSGIQLAALWFTGSRGPWVGLVFGVGAFALLGAMSLNRPQMIRSASVFAIGILIAALITLTTNLTGDSTEGSGRGLGSVLSGVTPAAGGLGARSDIWEGSVRLLDSWEVQDRESGTLSALRPVFGLGPEMYYYSYPLVANPQDGIIVVSHAHDWPLQLVLELGVTGLMAFIVLAVSVLIAGFVFIRKDRGDAMSGHEWLAIAMLAVIAALIGRSAEQIVGIARVGDLVPFWALLGAALAIYGIGRRGEAGIRPGSRNAISYAPLTVATVLAVAALYIFVARDIQMLRAGLISGDAFEEAAAGDRVEATNLLQKATDISPDVQQYYEWSGELLVERARAQADPGTALPLLGEAYETFSQYEKRDRLAFTTQLRIGLAEVELVLRGDDFRRNELINRMVRLADAMPSYPEIQAFAAERVLLASQSDRNVLELGLELANRAIVMEPETSAQPFAWFMRGRALGDLGDLDGAIESFTTALKRAPRGQFAPGIHENLARVYEATGDLALADEHRALAEEIQAALAGSKPG